MTAKFHVKRIVRVKMATEKEKKKSQENIKPPNSSVFIICGFEEYNWDKLNK